MIWDDAQFISVMDTSPHSAEAVPGTARLALAATPTKAATRDFFMVLLLCDSPLVSTCRNRRVVRCQAERRDLGRIVSQTLVSFNRNDGDRHP